MYWEWVGACIVLGVGEACFGNRLGHVLGLGGHVLGVSEHVLAVGGHVLGSG